MVPWQQNVHAKNVCFRDLLSNTQGPKELVLLISAKNKIDYADKNGCSVKNYSARLGRFLQIGSQTNKSSLT